ncbi:MAG: sulfotransferase, partial [Anaerolineales bacterium]
EGKLVDLARHLQVLRQRLFGKPVIPLKLQYPREKLKVVRYFHDRKALMGLVADFVDDIFLEATRQAGKTTWSEKTPQNIFHLGFLSELFPDSVFIHIKRDPRGVVYSMTKDSWDRAPEDVGDVCLLLKNMYQAWFDVKRKLDFSKLHYFEFKIEDIAASPEDMLEKIAYVCNLKGRYSNLPDISLSRVNAWQEDMSSPDVNTVEQELGDYIKGMGYDYK